MQKTEPILYWLLRQQNHTLNCLVPYTLPPKKVNSLLVFLAYYNNIQSIGLNKKLVEEAGGNCLPCMVDIRYEDQVVKAMEEGAKKFGGIDILVKLLVVNMLNIIE